MIDIAQCKNTLVKRDLLRKEANYARFFKAQSDFERIVGMIVEKYQPLRIYQWGSLLRTDQFQESSDIDIAIEGICDSETFFALLGDAMKMTDFSLDILQIEKIEPEFVEIIKMKGKVVYEH